LLANSIRNENDLEVNINSLNNIIHIKDLVGDIDLLKIKL